MCFPFTVDNRVPNNPLMTDRAPYDYPKAFKQWMELYRAIAGEALVYLLPNDATDFQDLPFVANIGAVLPHLGSTVVLANFKSEPRQGEEKIGGRFLYGLDYSCVAFAPHNWEGEADMKFIRDRLYIGGYGIRTDIESYRWMADAFDMHIVPVAMMDERLYHFDCLFFPLTDYKALVATSALDEKDVRAIEKHVEIIDVPAPYIYDGWTNAIRLNRKVLVDMPRTAESWNALEETIDRAGFEPWLIDLSEFAKSGADASCLVAHLNFNGRK